MDAVAKLGLQQHQQSVVFKMRWRHYPGEIKQRVQTVTKQALTIKIVLLDGDLIIPDYKLHYRRRAFYTGLLSFSMDIDCCLLTKRIILQRLSNGIRVLYGAN